MKTKIISFTLRLPKDLVSKLDKETKESKRSRNSQIEYILAERYRALDLSIMLSKKKK